MSIKRNPLDTGIVKVSLFIEFKNPSDSQSELNFPALPRKKENN